MITPRRRVWPWSLYRASSGGNGLGLADPIHAACHLRLRLNQSILSTGWSKHLHLGELSPLVAISIPALLLAHAPVSLQPNSTLLPFHGPHPPVCPLGSSIRDPHFEIQRCNHWRQLTVWLVVNSPLPGRSLTCVHDLLLPNRLWPYSSTKCILVTESLQECLRKCGV